MSRIRDALGWSGTDFTVTLFVVTSSPAPLSLGFEIGTVRPSSVGTFVLEDEDRVLGGLQTYEYDLLFNALPTELESYLRECLRQACSGGARFAWLAFEGTFSFEYILAEEFANQIYGVCVAGSEPVVVVDDSILASSEWKDDLRRMREEVWHSLAT
jgi:hypothetical protein